jgi:hypothetical protein
MGQVKDPDIRINADSNALHGANSAIFEAEIRLDH